ncbi:MAG: dTDP-glucose 4,6-dehydratase [Puniceicoccaceae bacterium]|nr:MAG: dTDP-glucose 4,6-dehydratase [Puniceicoccaceae bacterium]
MRLLITGGCGFIGSAFVRRRLAAAADPAADALVNLDALTYAGNADNLADLAAHPAYTFIHGDIGDQDLVARLLTEHRIEGIVHFAAESHVDRSIDSPEPFARTNVLGTLHLLEAARRHRQSLPPAAAAAFRFLHISTDEVFGSLGPDDPPFSETTPYAPNSPYAASKAAADHFARAAHRTYGLPVLITNCSNNYGPRQFPEKLIPLCLLNALEGRDLPLYGDGLQIRDWLHVDDHCRALDHVLDQGRPGETYAIGGNAEVTNRDLLGTLCAVLDLLRPRTDGLSYARQITMVADRPGHDRRYAMDCSKIRRELGWQPRESLQSGLEKTVRWYLENRAWCDAVTRTRYDRARLGTLPAPESRARP